MIETEQIKHAKIILTVEALIKLKWLGVFWGVFGFSITTASSMYRHKIYLGASTNESIIYCEIAILSLSTLGLVCMGIPFLIGNKRVLSFLDALKPGEAVPVKCFTLILDWLSGSYGRNMQFQSSVRLPDLLDRTDPESICLIPARQRNKLYSLLRKDTLPIVTSLLNIIEKSDDKLAIKDVKWLSNGNVLEVKKDVRAHAEACLKVLTTQDRDVVKNELLRPSDGDDSSLLRPISGSGATTGHEELLRPSSTKELPNRIIQTSNDEGKEQIQTISDRTG